MLYKKIPLQKNFNLFLDHFSGFRVLELRSISTEIHNYDGKDRNQMDSTKFNTSLLTNAQKFQVNFVDSPYRRPLMTITNTAAEKIVNFSYPWIFSKQILFHDKLSGFSPCLVNVESENGTDLGVAIYNRHSLISSRILTFNRYICINEAFFYQRMHKALQFRSQYYKDNFYRLVNAESDDLPGIIIDRYQDLICLQINVSGMDLLMHLILSAINSLLSPNVIILRNDSQIRKLEKLPIRREVIKGEYSGHTIIRENGLQFKIDNLSGQKTGWFYDQKFNRFLLCSNYCKNKSVLDLYSYVGSFGIQAAAYGASNVICVDSSESAIEHGRESAKLNGLENVVSFIQLDVFQFLEIIKSIIVQSSPKNEAPCTSVESNESTKETQVDLYKKNDLNTNSCLPKDETSEVIDYEMLGKSSSKILSYDDGNHQDCDGFSRSHVPEYVHGKLNIEDKRNKSRVKDNFIEKSLEASLKRKNCFDVIIIDPPFLARHPSLVANSVKIYERLIYKAGKILSPNGIIFVSSCSSSITKVELMQATIRALKWLNRKGKLLHTLTASVDHPVHISLNQTEYLTALIFHIE